MTRLIQGVAALIDGLPGDTFRLTLPADHDRTSGFEARWAREEILLEAPLIARIRETALPDAAILAAFHALLYRLTGQEAFTISVSVSEPPPERRPGSGTDPGAFAVVCRTRATEPFRALVTAAEGALRVFAQPAVIGDFTGADLPLSVDAGDLLLRVTPVTGSALIRIHYDSQLFEAVTIRGWLQAVHDLLTAGTSAPDREVSTLAPASGERPGLGAAVEVHRLIERHATRAPEHAALVFGDETVQYGTLDQRANAVAQGLVARGLGHGSVVALYLPRSADLVITLLGIMKAGAVCLPLDPADPPLRVTAILEDARAAVVITDRARRRQLPATELPILYVDDPAGGLTAGAGPVLPGADALESTACLFYACEACRLVSTPMSHATLAALLASVRTELTLTHEDVALAIARPSLDVSLIELLAPLSASACVVIAPDDVALDSERLIEAVGRSATTLMIAPTTRWAELLGETPMAWPRLKAVCFGDVPEPSLSAELVTRTGAAWSASGWTSGAVWTTLHRLMERDSADLLGHPLGHVSLRIVDPDGCEVTAGAVGELLVRLASPGTHTGAVQEWSRTGLQTRWAASGEVELVSGRSRYAFVEGFRVDLDDVARAIRRHAAVDDAEVVLATGGTADRLVACVVPRVGAGYSVSALRRELRRTVPAALVPQSFVAVGAIPRSPDGRAEFPGHHSIAPNGRRLKFTI